jgi:NSS family neurotransmitter:Na+ symporter
VAGASKDGWNSKIGVILAVTGSAVGLGNFLRFPGLAAQYDGGIFMIPYFVSLLLLGLPLAWAEWAMGRYGGVRGFNSSPGIFRVLTRNNKAAYLGVLGLIVPVVIYMYYVFIEAWCLGYAWYYLTGALNLGDNLKPYSDFFSTFTGVTENGAMLDGSHTTPLVFVILCVVMNFALIYRGLSKGIETFCLWAMPALVVCAVVVLIRVLTLGTPEPALPDQNVIKGLAYMWEPHARSGDFLTSLLNGQMWMQAAGQIFFSLSVGFGVVITYSSYLKRRDDIALSSTTAVAGNEFCEVVLGGLITIPAAFIFLGPEQIKGVLGTFSLGFQALPMVFHHMPLGQFFGFLWFFLLFLAAITSSLSMLQPAIAFLEEGLNIQRKASVLFLGLITLAGNGLVIYFTKGFTALDTMDFWVGTFCIFLLATIQTFIFGWVLGIKKGMKELHTGSEIHIPSWVGFLIKYVSPLYLIGIFALWTHDNFKGSARFHAMAEDTTVQIILGFVAVIFILFMVLITVALRRWNRTAPLEGIES